ncbi:MAG: ATPase, T2SS/T4P/T4SS family [Pirellulaceae bacterium]|jgi:type II secretory ATPase GspE/PulE/Tfp pilus assembly ATPase PilB-like protein
MLRRNKKKKKSRSSKSGAEDLPQVVFKPKAADKAAEQGIMIACRGIEQFPAANDLIAQALLARADQIMLDYSQQGVAIRIRVDGLWESLPPLDRETGDPVLVILKKLCNLNPADRRSRQIGSLPLSMKGTDWIVSFTSQGIVTGERVLMRIEPKKQVLNNLGDLGMREKMQQQLRDLLNSDKSIFVFSGVAGHALPTMWRVGLESADRFVRDFHSIEDVTVGDPELINIGRHTFDTAAGETPMTVLKSLLLKQPDALILPDLFSPEIAKLICSEVANEGRYAITRIVAGSSIEAIIKLMATYPASAKSLVKLTCGCINLRLLRRLCTECREPFQPTPQLLQKLGLPAGRVQTLYKPNIPPPPEQRFDAQGKPLEIEICKQCNGRGYYGRMGVFELLQLNDEIRQALLKKPDVQSVLAVARKSGFLTLQEEGALAVAQGLTSLQELQRVLYPAKKA